MRCTRYMTAIAVLVASVVFPTTALAQDEWSPGSALKCDYDGQRVQLPYNELAAISGPASPEDLPSGYELSFIVLLKRLPSLQEKYDKYVDEVTDRRVPPEDRLSYEEKIARFGPSEADVRELSRWLRSGGFEIAGVTPRQHHDRCQGNCCGFR